MNEADKTIPAIYPGTMPPALRVACIVGWNGRQFQAVRLMHPKQKALRWATYRDGEVVWLPPQREARTWGLAPEWWRPAQPEHYPGRLPEPIAMRARPNWPPPPAPDTGKMIESDDPAKAGNRSAWWLDPAAITYSPPGEISRAEAEGRVMRAVSCAGVDRAALGMGPDLTGAVLADLMDAIDAALGAGDDSALPAIVERFQPLPADHGDWLVAMAWFSVLNPPEEWHGRRQAWALNQRQRLLIWRSGTQPYSWTVIAGEINRSKTRARQLYEDAIDKVSRAANQQRVFDHFTPRDHMADVRAGNAAHRRRGA